MNKSVQQFTAFVCLFCHLASTTVAQGPAWWVSRGVIDPAQTMDDYAVANQGQLKNFAAAAAAQMAVLPNGGAGPGITAMIQDWQTQHAQADDYAAATVGQAKAVAVKFYQRLQQLGLTSMPPWTTADTDDDNHAAINLGQLKSLFAFVIPASTARSVTLAGLNMSPPTLLGSSLSVLLNRGDRSDYGFGASGIADIPSILRSTGQSGGPTSFPGKIDKSKVRVEFSNRSYWYSWYWSNLTSPEVAVVEGASSGIGYEHDPDFSNSSYLPSAWTVKHFMTNNRGITGSGPQSTNALKNMPGYRLIELWDFSQFPGTAAVWTTPAELNFDNFNDRFGRNNFGFHAGIGEYFHLDNGQHWEFDHGYNPPRRLRAFNNEETRLSFGSHSFTIKLTEPVSYAVRVPLTEYVTDRSVVTGNRTYYAEFDPGQTTSDPVIFHSKLSDFKFVDQTGENYIDESWHSYLELGEPEPVVWDSPPLKQLDIAGPARRKIALNGVPLPDEQPQKSPESDQPREESYIDGYNLALKHSTSDVFVPQGASQFPLSVQRHAQEVTWTTRSDLPVRERMTEPFGQGWGSNLCSYVDFRRDSNGAARAVTVVDENGSSQQFLDLGNEYEVLPFSATDAKSFMNTLKKETINGVACLVYEKKYGTRLVFESKKIVTRADDLPKPDKKVPLSYTLGNPSSGNTFAAPGFLPGGSWSRQIIASNAGTPGVWKHQDGTEVTLTSGNLAYVRGIDESGEEGVYVALVEREEATDLGLHWDELEKGVPEWTSNGADNGPTGQGASMKGTHLRDALEVRNKRATTKSYSKGKTSGATLPLIAGLPTAWDANKRGYGGNCLAFATEPQDFSICTGLHRLLARLCSFAARYWRCISRTQGFTDQASGTQCYVQWYRERDVSSETKNHVH